MSRRYMATVMRSMPGTLGLDEVVSLMRIASHSLVDFEGLSHTPIVQSLGSE
jgi:hypothetical protein